MKKEFTIPFLPGLQLPNQDKEIFHTSQTFKVKDAVMCEKLNHSNINSEDLLTVDSLKMSFNSGFYNSKIRFFCKNILV